MLELRMEENVSEWHVGNYMALHHLFLCITFLVNNFLGVVVKSEKTL